MKLPAWRRGIHRLEVVAGAQDPAGRGDDYDASGPADGGGSFTPLGDGREVVEGFDPAEITFHDPHCVRRCPRNPDRLYQQNHCGIYRRDRPARRWQRIAHSRKRK